MNDREREEWIQNDEGLYLWWKQSRKGITTFVRENRKEIDQLVNNREDRDAVFHRFL